MSVVFDIIIKYREGIIEGLMVTLQLCLYIWLIGIIFGVMIGTAGAKWGKSVGLPTRILSFILSCIPILVILFWMHFPLQAILNITVEPFYSTVAALAIVNTFLISDVIRGAIINLPKQYSMVGEVYGLKPYTIFRKIELPLVLREVIPTVLIIQVNMLQMTLFASLISVDEIFRVAQRINAFEYKPVEIYSSIAIFFILICLPLNLLSFYLKEKFTRDITER